jgi:hypothetical protein
MRKTGQVAGGAVLALILGVTIAPAQDRLGVAGHDVQVSGLDTGATVLMVDGQPLHENGVIYLDPKPLTLDGVTVVTGSAGAGGNACNPAPFVLALPEGGPPEFWGPLDSCAYFTPSLRDGRLVFVSDPLPATPGEAWAWSREGGFVPGPAVEFVAKAGWDGFDKLAGAHPVDALALMPVLETLQQGLGADFDVYAGLISGLGSGNLTGEGYLGSACLKLTCDTDWAILYLHRETKGIFAIWQTYEDSKPHVWPTDRALWPPEPLTLLDWSAPEE